MEDSKEHAPNTRDPATSVQANFPIFVFSHPLAKKTITEAHDIHIVFMVLKVPNAFPIIGEMHLAPSAPS